jgi:DNA-binding response OmpR family regulator
MLPGMDGSELVRALDASTIAPVPTIVTSAMLDLSRIKGKRWPVVERVEKPFHIETLINAVENAARKGVPVA